MTTKTEQVPVEAFRFAGDVTIDKAEGNKNVPFTILARTGDSVCHWYWGRCIHDMAGMKSVGRFAVDYLHSQEEAIGYCDSQSVSDAGLICSGALTPYMEGDRASEIIDKSNRGVPYQASIDFDEFQIKIEDVPTGMTTEVNGKTEAGPCTVFREWTLQGLAVCLRGVDGQTSVQLSKSRSGKTVAVTRFTKGQPMPDTPETTTETEVVTESEATTTEAVVTDPVIETTTTEAPAVDATKLTRKQQAKQFTDEFGEEHGVALFARCESIEEARSEFTKIVLAENKTLKGQLAKQASGGAKPASFGVTPEAGTATKFSGLSPSLSRVAAGIKMPVSSASTAK